MSDNVLIVLIVAAAVVVVLFMFRGQLKKFRIKADKDGVESTLETKPENLSQPGKPASRSGSSMSVSENKLLGKNNQISVSTSSPAPKHMDVDDNLLAGEGQKIDITTGPKDESQG
jgi:hypothetical protein